jgi:hypothetical protein
MAAYRSKTPAQADLKDNLYFYATQPSTSWITSTNDVSNPWISRLWRPGCYRFRQARSTHRYARMFDISAVKDFEIFKRLVNLRMRYGCHSR